MKFFLDYDFIRIIVLPVYAGDTWHILLAADSLCEEPVPDLPGEHRGVLLLVFTDGVHHGRGGHLGLAATNNTSFVISSLVISNENKFFEFY